MMQMSESELPAGHPITVELSPETVMAAAECGLSLAEWMAEALALRLEHHAAARKAAARRTPGPWPGWETATFTVGQREYRIFHGPGGAEIHYAEDGYAYHRSAWRATSSRPWMARTVEDCLRSKNGKVRVFATAEAARNALHSA
jgi:hypothetical protein